MSGQKCCKITPFLHVSFLISPLLTLMNTIMSPENAMMLMSLHCGRFYPTLQTQLFQKKGSNLDVYDILKGRKWGNIAPVLWGDDRTCLRSRPRFMPEPGTEADLLSCQPAHYWENSSFSLFSQQKSMSMNTENQLPKEIIAWEIFKLQNKSRFSSEQWLRSFPNWYKPSWLSLIQNSKHQQSTGN